MAVEFGTIANFGLIALIINGVLIWIRELKKGKISNGNGKHLEEIKETMSLCEGKLTAIDGKVGETNIQVAKINTAVNSQKSQCSATIKRFDKAIGDQNRELISLAKDSGRKR